MKYHKVVGAEPYRPGLEDGFTVDFSYINSETGRYCVCKGDWVITEKMAIDIH